MDTQQPAQESNRDYRFEEIVLRKTLDANGRLKPGMTLAQMREEHQRLNDEMAANAERKRQEAEAHRERMFDEAANTAATIAREETDRKIATARRKLAEAGIDTRSMADDDAIAAWEVEFYRRRSEEAKEQAQRMADHAFKQSGCPGRHVQNLDKIKPEGKWESVAKELMEDHSQGCLYALLGIRGNGKTQLAVWVIRAACNAGETARYVKALDLFREIRATFRKDATTDENALIEKYANVDLLVIDEAHQRGNSEFEQNTLINLIDRRYDAMLATILIANQTKAEFAAAIGDSVVSRIHESGRAIICDWPSFRTK